MCGITGFFNLNGESGADADVLRRMNRTLVRRGPDDEGYYLDGSVGLAMRRLSIIDLEGGHQPICNEDESVWTVFNGEIYNFQELRQELIQKGHRLKCSTDTEVIVHLYEEYGEEFVHKLRGMFAIALWDKPAQKLLLLRDRVGIKPLYYGTAKGTLVFGSELKAVLEFPGFERQISFSALSDYLSFLYIPAPKTIYQDIFKLEAGHYLRIQNGRFQLIPYWDFRYQPQTQVSEKEWCDRVWEGLNESVRLHMISDVSLGAFLSGGMDSSIIVACMAEQSKVPAKTYSIGFSDSRFNELPYAKEVAEAFHTDHHEAKVEADAFDLLPRIIGGFDEPFADSSAIPTYLVSEFARRDVKVALSGDGGDELFGGYLWTQKELWMNLYRSLPRGVKRGIEQSLLGENYQPLRERGVLNLLKRFCYDSGLSPADGFARRAMSFQPWMKEQLFEPEILRQIGKEKSLERIQKFSGPGAPEDLISKFLYLDSKIYLPDDLLTKVDRMSMMHSLEVRVPFLDHHLIELAGSIPTSYKIRKQSTKYILRQTMKGKLPPRVLEQRKQGFAVPLQRWFQNELSGFARNLLLSSESQSRHYFKSTYLRWLLDEHEAGRQRFGTQIYALVIFELWSRMNLRQFSGAANGDSLTLKDFVS